jgi:hypothetical protein
MKSGFAPTTTMSSTTMPTRSWPIVSCLSIACAIATFVPTPSVLEASSGRVAEQGGGVEEAGESADAAEHLGSVRARTADFISSTAIARRRIDAGLGIGAGRTPDNPTGGRLCEDPAETAAIWTDRTSGTARIRNVLVHRRRTW